MRLATGTIVTLLLTALAAAQTPQAARSVLRSPHNLSASGPGKLKAPSEQEVCIFCHTPHNASTVQPAWNRQIPASSYRIYSSATLIAQPGQPTGSSKLCLSCHDGTIALGDIISRGRAIPLTGSTGPLPQGATNLGTDLSGDHPISFKYDAVLAAKDGNLVNPATLAPQLHLENGQVQCTTCHDPHDDSRGNFLVMDNSRSQLCTSCHVRTNQAAITGHDQCADCHVSHKAPSGAMLLNRATVSATCLSCHGGSATPTAQIAAGAALPNATINPSLLQGPSVAADLSKISHHDTDNSAILCDVHAGTVKPNNLVNCADCHEPHTIASGSAAAPLLPPTYGKVSGVSATGVPLPHASHEFEVCFKCHGLNSPQRPSLTRHSVQTSVPLQFAPNAVSFHPVEAPGIGRDVPSLISPLNIGSIIYCADCHASDTGKDAGGGGPNGPHGSNFRPMLIAEYDALDGTSESASAYALCYRCHQRTSILNNESFSRHSLHVVDQRTPCSVCHDAHGISAGGGTMRQNAHLVNFDATVVRPDPITHQLEYRVTGMRSGKCYLTCHGKVHSGLKYP